MIEMRVRQHDRLGARIGTEPLGRNLENVRRAHRETRVHERGVPTKYTLTNAILSRATSDVSSSTSERTLSRCMRRGVQRVYP